MIKIYNDQELAVLRQWCADYNVDALITQINHPRVKYHVHLLDNHPALMRKIAFLH